MTTDELAPFFESRDTRVGRLPTDAQNSFRLAEQSAVTAGEKDFGDRQFVSLWLARRTGMPRKDVLANFDAIAGRFFGDGATASNAYDAIANACKQFGGTQESGDTAVTQPQAGQTQEDYADVSGLTKIGRGVFMQNGEQSGRSVGAGFEEVAQQIPAGLYSQASVVMASPGAPKSPFENRTYLDLYRERQQILRPPFWPYAYDKTPTDAEAKRLAKIDADMATLRDRTNEENRTRLKDFATSDSKAVSEEYRRLANFWYDLSGDASKRWGVDTEFEKTAMGQFMKSAGSVPATAALAAMGPVGGLSMESMFYGQVEQERMQHEGAAYDPNKAASANLASALPQMVLERAFGVERLMNKVLGETAKQGGRVALGDFAKNFVKEGLTAGVEEGITEPVQNFWNDYVASLTYDQKRELFTEDAAKQRLLESVSAFALGFLFGGGVKTLEGVDHNRQVTQGERYLTTREGQPFTEHDFQVLRGVKSDQELLSTAPDEETGRLLVSAVNGDKTAQAAYNNRTLAALFTNTEGVNVNGMSLGTVQNVPALKMADGVVIPLDLTKEEDRTFIDNFKREAARVTSLNETTDMLQKGMEEGRTIQVTDEAKTLKSFIDEGALSVDEAAKRIGIAQDMTTAELPEGTKPEDVRVLGANMAEYKDGVFRDVSHIYQGGDAMTAIEEVAEGYAKKRLAVGDLAEGDLARWRDAYEAATGTKTDTKGTVSNIEWFSKRVVDYAVANRKTEGMPKSWGAFFRTLGEHLKTVIRLSERMKKLKRDGTLGEDFETALKGALGMVTPGEVVAKRGMTAEQRARLADLEAAFGAGTKPDAAQRESFAEYQKLKADLADQAAAADRALIMTQRAQVEAQPTYGITENVQLSRQAVDMLASQGLTPEDLTFAVTGVPQNAQQALQAQAMALRAKKLAASAQLAARLRSGQPLPQRAALVRKQTQASLLARLAVPISSRLKAINPELGQRLRRFEFDLGKQIQGDFKQAEGFIRGFEKMRDADARMLDLALKNGDTATRDTILAAYNLTGEFARVQRVLDATKARAIAAGYDFGEVQDYFPRKVNDVDGLFMHYYGKPQGGRIEEVLREAQKAAAAQGRVLTQDERVEIVNSVLRGFRPPESKPANLKERRTDVVDVDADQFYADSVQALASYIEQMNGAIERRKFFGKYAVTMQSATGGMYSSNKLALDASIGGIVEDMIASGKITRAQQAEVQSILQARFGQESSSPFIRAFKSLSYMGTMGQITSAMSQLQDLAFSLYEAGVYDSIVAGAQAVTRTSKISRKELGLEGIAEEFRYQEGLHKALDRVFKLVGIHYLDMIGKETLVNARFRQLQRQAAAGKLDTKARELINTSFGPTVGPRVVSDFARGVKNEDTLFATYSILSDYQPISLSEYPEFYLRHPNGRVFYMLKSFMLKQIDAFRRESFSLIVHGTVKQKVTGFKNLTHMAALLYLIGLPTDWLKDWIMGRDPQMGDLAVDNVIKLFGVNRWNLYQFRESKDPVQAALLLAAPPAPFLVYPLKDVANVATQIAKGDDIKPGDFESWRMLPFVGSPIYWWFGGGAKNIEDKKRKRERGRVNP